MPAFLPRIVKCQLFVIVLAANSSLLFAQRPHLAATAATNSSGRQVLSRPVKSEDVRQAVTRVFADAATVDAAQNKGFAVGDFNGDGSQDLAVWIIASDALVSQTKTDLANWTAEDPRQIIVPDGSKRVRILPPKPPRPVIASGTKLLAIIHGYGRLGWRNPQARQTILLANLPFASLLSRPARTLTKPLKRGLPLLRGDLIFVSSREITGFLFWINGQYAFRAIPSTQIK